VDALVDAPLTYDEQGATAGSLPCGYFHVEREWELGRGEACYDVARRALGEWRMLPSASWFRVHPDPTVAASGDVLTWSIKLLGVWWFSAVRLLQQVDAFSGERATSVTIGTLPGHYGCGEERFEVAWLEDDRVVYRLRSFSRWSRWMPRLAPWIVRSAQRRFGLQSGAGMLRAVREGSAS